VPAAGVAEAAPSKIGTESTQAVREAGRAAGPDLRGGDPPQGALARMMLAPGLVVELLRSSDENAVRTAIIEGLAPYRTASGSYRLENEWHYLIARA